MHGHLLYWYHPGMRWLLRLSSVLLQHLHLSFRSLDSLHCIWHSDMGTVTSGQSFCPALWLSLRRKEWYPSIVNAKVCVKQSGHIIPLLKIVQFLLSTDEMKPYSFLGSTWCTWQGAVYLSHSVLFFVFSYLLRYNTAGFYLDFKPCQSLLELLQ